MGIGLFVLFLGAGLPLIVAFETPKVANVLDLVFHQELLGEALVPGGTTITSGSAR
jgi:hypothetical protein